MKEDYANDFEKDYNNNQGTILSDQKNSLDINH